MTKKVSVGEAAVFYGVSQTTIHTWIKEEKIQSERVLGRRWVLIENDNNASCEASQGTYQGTSQTFQTDPQGISQASQASSQVEKVEIENKYLKQTLADKEKQIDDANHQIKELLKQQDQGQQLAAMQQKTIDKLTEQNQLLLETSQEEKKVGFWGRLIGQRA
mgnify:FL=1